MVSTKKKSVVCSWQTTLHMERETGFEPATSTLARLHSTTELLPQSNFPLTLRVMEAASRFELEMEVLQTSALPLGYAAIFLWSGRRDLNPRLQPWQGCTLPLSYSRSTQKSSIDFTHRCQQGFSGKRHFSLRKKFLLYITSYYSIQRIHPHSSSGAAQQSRGAFHPAS